MTDPDHVLFEVLEAGFATDRLLASMGGLQKLYCYNMLTLFSRLYGAEPSQIIQDMGATLNYTTFKDGVVSLGNRVKAGDLENDACIGIQGAMIYGAQWSNSEGKTRDMSATITFPPAGSGVENVVAEATEAPAEFFDLHGRRLANPAPGTLVIRRCGAQVDKVIVR